MVVLIATFPADPFWI